MKLNWNGNIVTNNYEEGDSLLAIMVDVLAAPCAIVSTGLIVMALYSMTAPWYWYGVAVFGPITGLFVAILISMMMLFVVGVLYLAVIPFYVTIKRVRQMRP